MKKYIILAFASLLALTSCESFLDRSPLSDLSPSSYFKDKAEMKNWNAVYMMHFKVLFRKDKYFSVMFVLIM